MYFWLPMRFWPSVVLMMCMYCLKSFLWSVCEPPMEKMGFFDFGCGVSLCSFCVLMSCAVVGFGNLGVPGRGIS